MRHPNDRAPHRDGVPSRGINGTMAILENKLFLPENDAATYVDLTAPCANPTVNPNPAPCSSTTVDFLTTPPPAFVSGIGVDRTHHYVSTSHSTGGANPTLSHFHASTPPAHLPGARARTLSAPGGR